MTMNGGTSLRFDGASSPRAAAILPEAVLAVSCIAAPLPPQFSRSLRRAGPVQGHRPYERQSH